MTTSDAPLPALPPLADATTVVAALRALPPGATVATDADETLWAGDVGDEVMRCAEAGAPWPVACVQFADYEREMAGGDYQGACRWSARVLAMADSPLARAALLPVLAQVAPRRWLFDALNAAAQRGVHVWVVSASPRPVVQWGVEHHALQVAGVIGIEVDGGHVQEPAPVGWGKVAAWQERGLPRPALALGDSAWDGPLLAMAERGYLLSKATRDPFAQTPAAELADLHGHGHA